MDLQYCAAVLNRFIHGGHCQWVMAPDGSGVCSEDPHEWLTPVEATAVVYLYEHPEIHEGIGVQGLPLS